MCFSKLKKKLLYLLDLNFEKKKIPIIFFLLEISETRKRNMINLLFFFLNYGRSIGSRFKFKHHILKPYQLQTIRGQNVLFF